jgi:Stage II sporulation protein E (SpoIIE)
LHVRLSPLFFLLLFASALAAVAQATPPLVIEGVGTATAPLDGKWQFHTGDDAAWASPTLDDSGWEAIAANQSWGEQNHFGYTGYAWYRRHLDVVPVAGSHAELAVFMPPVDDSYEVYWNGHLVGQGGKLPPHPVWYFQSPYRTFGLGAPQAGVLALRVWKAPYTSFDSGTLGGPRSNPLIGSSEAVAAHKEGLDHRWLASHQYDFALDLLYGLVALLSFLAWFRNRDQKLLFWVSMYSLEPLLAQTLVAFRIPFSYVFSLGVLQPLISIGDISLWFLLLYLLQLDDRPRLLRWTRTLSIISLIAASLDGLLTIWAFDLPNPIWFQIPDAIFTLIFTSLEAFPLLLIALALRKRLDAARWFVAIFAFLRDGLIVLRTALEQGARFTHISGDKITAPLFAINGNEFNARTLASTLLFISIVYAVYRYTVEQGRRQGALEQEFRSAQELQRILIPETLPSIAGYSITSAYRPAEEVGGDFFQLIPQDGGATLLILGDVSGKGLKAAMTVSLIVGAARTLAETLEDPAEILSGLNRRLQGRVQDGFVTCLVLRLDADGGCVMSNAGHPPPYWNQQELSHPPALPLGLVAGAEYETTSLVLSVGDRLTLYTDGLLEARNAAGELYSFDRLQNLIATEPDARQASEVAVAFGQEDDITVLTVTRLATGVESTTLLLAPALVSATS